MATRWTRAAGAWGFVCGLAMAGACSSPSDGAPPTMSIAGKAGSPAEVVAGSDAGGDGSAATCVSGEACECSSGLMSRTVCEGEEQSCDCAICPATAPAAPAAAYVPCGGEPFGTWRLKAYDTSEVMLAVNVQGEWAASTRCAAAVQGDEEPEMALRIDSGGSGRMNFGGLPVTGSILESCAKQELHTKCDGLAQCKAGACGTCDCHNSIEAYTGSLSWTRNGTQLTLDAGNLLAFEYCVEDSILTLKLSSAPSVILELERVMPVGRPADCAERATMECLGAGCHVGTCTGAATCSARIDEAACTKVQGCVWDKTACGGNSAAACDLEDYGKVAGCELTTKAVQCIGTPSPCKMLDDRQCAATPGCVPGLSCSGTPKACNGKDADACLQVLGCTPADAE
jgi:hypothetical protein